MHLDFPLRYSTLFIYSVFDFHIGYTQKAILTYCTIIQRHDLLLNLMHISGCGTAYTQPMAVQNG